MDQALPFEDGLVELLPRLRRFARALTHSPFDSDDLVQLTIERALRSRDHWQPGSRLDSWTYRIMRNLWIDIARSRSRKEKFEAPPDEAEHIGEDPSASIEASVDLARIAGAMQRLPEEQREVVALILIEGFGYREVSEMLDVPIGTVSSRLVRGRTTLLEMVGER